MLPLSAAFLGSAPPAWLRGAGAGAGAAVAAVALHAGLELARRSGAAPRPRGGDAWSPTAWPARSPRRSPDRGWSWSCSPAAAWSCWPRRGPRLGLVAPPWPLAAVMATGGLGALAWTAFKVGALSYGGGFVIVPLMQGDAVDTYGWMTDAQFVNAVALGQVTPGPVVATIAAVGYAAHGVAGALLASGVAFAPSFAFVLLGADRFERLSPSPDAPKPSSAAPAPRRSARSSAPPSRSPGRSASPGSPPSWPRRRYPAAAAPRRRPHAAARGRDRHRRRARRGAPARLSAEPPR